MAQETDNQPAQAIGNQVSAELTRVLTPSLETELRRARSQDQLANQAATTGQTNQLVEPDNRFTAGAPDESRSTTTPGSPTPSAQNTSAPLPTAPSRENELNRARNQDKTAAAKDQENQATDKTPTSEANNSDKKDDTKKDDKKEDDKSDVSKMAGKKATAAALTEMWGAVWLDWTLLTLLGLNAYFVGTWFTDKIAGFGEDNLFGRMLGKELAKWFEIIMLFVIDAVIVGIIVAIGYGGYKLYNCDTSAKAQAAIATIPGGKSPYEVLIEQCFNQN